MSTTSRVKLDARVYDWAEKNLGPVAQNLSKLIYEEGTGGKLKAIIGYEIALPDTWAVSILPLRIIDGKDDPAFNEPGCKGMTLATINTSRIISIEVTGHFPEEN